VLAPHPFLIPSVKAITDSLARAIDMTVFHMEDIGPRADSRSGSWGTCKCY